MTDHTFIDMVRRVDAFVTEAFGGWDGRHFHAGRAEWHISSGGIHALISLRAEMPGGAELPDEQTVRHLAAITRIHPLGGGNGVPVTISHGGRAIIPIRHEPYPPDYPHHEDAEDCDE